MNEELDGQAIKKLTIRVPVSTYLALDSLARAARIPIAAAARQILIDRVPVPAPPLAAELSAEARELLRCIGGLRSNLSQLNDHAARLGGPLTQLAGPDGHLSKLSGHARALGLSIKSGQLVDPSAALHADLIAGAELVNQLARRLNLDQTVPVADWRAPLAACAIAFAREDE